MALPQEVFERRRRRFLNHIGAGSAAIFAAAPESIRSNDTEHRYRQNSDFYYLTGFPEPGAVALFLPGHPKDEYVLFVRPRDIDREIWTGRRFGVEGAMERFGPSIAYSVEEIEQKLPPYLAECERLYFAIDRDDSFNERVLRWFRHAYAGRQRSGSGPTALIDPREIVHEMRLRKEEEELCCMRRAAAITAEAHFAAMRAARPGMPEYEIEALIDYAFRRAGATAPAYATIVASGPNCTILHYTANDRTMQKEDLLLIDAGAEFDFYCADVTRTIPVGGKYEGRQRAIYEIVLRAQREAIEAVRPGARIEDVHRCALAALVDGLLALGLLSGTAEEIIEKELYKPYYMHRTSHWLGIDVHDAGAYKIAGESRILEPGMVLTVEPGLYFGEHVEAVNPEWRGIGVRIEDDVLVTADGHEVLTASIPKEIDEIEALRGEGANVLQ